MTSPERSAEGETLLGLRRDLGAAGLVQKRMWPPSPHLHCDYRIEYEIHPASELSGDFVDYCELPNGDLVFVVADVAGHGTAAALVTVLLKSFMTRLSTMELSQPAQILVSLNAELLRLDLERHVCALVGLVGPHGKVTLASAGAFPQPFVRRASATAMKVTAVELSGRALGLFEGESFGQSTLVLERGDQITVVTDGVLDLVSGDGMAHKEEQLAIAAAEPTAAEFWHKLTNDPVAPRADDVTRFNLERST